jgi:2-polyprenyl-3-methyl-5-hydroxy-6-metoxy-1,4-benzoquinol methylase
MEHNGFSILRCVACSFMFARLPEGTNLVEVYRDDSYWTGGHDYGYQNYDSEWTQSEHLYLARLARTNELCMAGRMLEIGCAAGNFIKAARDTGWVVAGVEVSEMMRQRAAAATSAPIYESLAAALAREATFDCVVMFEVLEHLQDPLAVLGEVTRGLASNGLLALSTPNFASPAAACDPFGHEWFTPPAHVSYFAPDTLRSCVVKAGFEILELSGVLNVNDVPLPGWLDPPLRLFRRGKQLRPGGVLGKLIKRYQRSRKDLLQFSYGLELYARKATA